MVLYRLPKPPGSKPVQVNMARKATIPPKATHDCRDCSHSIPEDWTFCPHCGRPQLFPNVIIAERDDQRAVLESRFQAAMRLATSQNCKAVAESLYDAVGRSSQAVDLLLKN